jgi:nucleoside-diphosphate-sugar epimerase
LLPIPESAPAAPISPYGVSKLLGEWYGRVFLDLYGLEFVALRYFNVFGPRQDPGSPYSGVLSLFNTAARNHTQPTIYGDGEQSRDFVYVGNVAEANCIASEAPKAPGHCINIGMGAHTTLNQALSLLGKITGRALAAKHGPVREGDIRNSQADISSAKTLLGYDPKITFEQGLKKTWKWFSAGAA